MAWYNQFPWTDFHQLNLDWIIKEIKTNSDNIAQNDADIERLVALIDNISPGLSQSNYVTVGKAGAMFTDINSAVDFVKKYCSQSNRVAIVIYPGEYIADIDLAPNPGIDMIGIGKPVITSASTGYPHTALYTAGQGYFEGIEFVGTVAYGVHVEVQGLSGNMAGYTTFRNCRFTSPNGSGLGAGIGLGNYLACYDCEFSSPTGQYGLYLHQYPGADSPVTATFVSCNFALSGSGVARIDDAANNYGGHSAPLVITFKDCISYNGAENIIEFHKTDSEVYNGIYYGSNITLRSCEGNTHPALEHYINETYLQWATCSSLGTTYRVPFDLASDLFSNVTVTGLFVNGVKTYTGNWTGAVIRGKSALGLVSPTDFQALTNTDVLVTYTATWGAQG